MPSTKFTTACYILSFIAYHGQRKLSSGFIAKWVNTNPSRVRQLISLLVQAGLLTSTRGGKGGVQMARDPDTITLLEVFDAVSEPDIELFSVEDPFSEWKEHCFVHGVLTGLQDDMQRDIRARLAGICLSSMYRPEL